MASADAGDGDQSPLRGARAQEARNTFAAVGETFSFLMLPSDFQKAAWRARVDLLQRFLSSPQREELLKQREPRLNFPVLHLVVFGAQRSKRTGPAEDYPQACQLLLEAGANVHARDRNGYTALHHATSHHPQLDLARILLKHGADPNARNRFGNNPLMEPVMLNNFESCKLLYDAGADPDLEDFDGFSARKIGMPFPALMALFAGPRGGGQASGASGGEGAKGKPRRAEEELGLTQCSACEKKMTPVSQKLCGRCHVQVYCSKECQRTDWKVHKLSCKSEAKPCEVVVTPVVDGYMSSLPNSQFLEVMARESVGEATKQGGKKDKYYTSTDETNAAYAQKEGRYFVLKVQVGLDMVTRKPTPKQALMAYNHNRKFQCLIDEKDPGHKLIFERVAAEGVMGLKAYFNAYVNKDKKLVVVTSPVLPAQPW